MAARVFTFVSHDAQVRRRGMRNYCRWVRITKGLEPYGPEERKRIREEQVQFERWSRAWVQRHHPLPGGALVAKFPSRDAVDRPRKKRG